MNRFAAFVAFVATIVATLALTSTSASAGKPPPSPTDPCAGANLGDFPALAFTRKRTTGGVVYYDRILSDSTGKCQKTVFVSEPFGGSGGGPAQLRYNRLSRTGLMVGNGAGYTYRAFPFAVSFDPITGVPIVTPTLLTSSQILALSDFAIPLDLEADGWSQYVMSDPSISPDGTKLLAFIAFQKTTANGVQMQRKTYWTCPFSVSAPTTPLNALTCTEVFRGLPDEYPNASWGAQGSDSLYIVKALNSGSGAALFRLQPLTQYSTATPTQLWSLGTAFLDARAGLVNGSELVAVYEGGGTSGCNRILVASCGAGSCAPVNGGTPARTMTWLPLPDGRLAGEGQTARDRKGTCSPSGSIVTFGPNDSNLTTTTIVPVGSSPRGAGSQ